MGSGNIALGFNAGSNLSVGNNNIDIGNPGVAGESNTIRIGSVQTKTFIAGVRGRTTGVANAVPVLIDSNGQLGTASSSRRFKNDIKSMDQASAAILGLKPVTFHYKSDSTNTPQFGLIAEEVAQVNPDLVVRDENGEIYTVRYEAVNAMLLNEFLKEHCRVEQQEATIAQLKSTVAHQQKDLRATAAQQRKEFESKIAQQQKQIEALATGLQKVSAQVEASKPAQQMVANNQ
jgi:trimeric autotransporter adhesin